MSLFDLLYAEPNITGSLGIRLDVLDLGSTTAANNLDTSVGEINFSASQIPDIIAGNSAPNTLIPGAGTSVSIPPVSISIRYPTYTLIEFSSIISATAFEFSTSISNSFTQAIPIEFPNTQEDFLVGFGASDTLFGEVGNDVLIGDGVKPNEAGGDGSDTLDGGAGVDVLLGGGLGDSLIGGAGDDLIFGDYFLGLSIASIGSINLNRNVYSVNNRGIAELDFLGFIPIANASYSASVNVVFGPVSVEFGSGNEGNDTVFGGDGSDIVFGDKGNDLVNGDAGNDYLFGNANNDTLNGGTGDDFIFGDTLAPNFYGPDGIDSIDGGDGNDVLVGGGAGDVVIGGSGDDKIFGDYFFGFISGSILINTPPFNIPANIPVLPEIGRAHV